MGLRSKPLQGGSLYFSGATSASNILVPNNADFQMTGDFTVEWWQRLASGAASNMRVFGVDTWPNEKLAVSLEGSDTSRNFYLWLAGSSLTTVESSQNYLNTWIHFAISRSGSSIRVFKNGTQIGSTITNSGTMGSPTLQLAVGNDTNVTAYPSRFKGNISNFHVVKGTALYTSNFTTPSTPFTPVANSVLLLSATSSATAFTDSSPKAKVSTAGADVSYQAGTRPPK
jgi:hypothetical protein